MYFAFFILLFSCFYYAVIVIELFNLVDCAFLRIGPGIADYPPVEEAVVEETKKEMTREELVKMLTSNRDTSLPSQNGLGMN